MIHSAPACWKCLKRAFFGIALGLATAVLPQAASGQNTDPNKDPFPAPPSKKGLQVQMVEDALALGIRHAALNVNFGQMPDLAEKLENFHATFGGKTYSFQKSYIEHLDAQIKPLSDAGVVVSLILLNYRGGDEALNRILLHPKYDPTAPNHLSAFNTSSPEAAGYYSACVEFLARRYSGGEPQNGQAGRVWNYIVGNEVNSHWFWANMGRAGMEEFTEDYLRAVRLAHAAVRRHSANARVYLSLEHHWNIRYPGGDERQAFPGRAFLEYFARRAREEGDFDWHVAFHPYPENLFQADTWKDRSATFSPETERITFKNLEVLPRFLARPEMRFDGAMRRIILSEQGFHSPESAAKPGEPDGETLQAAAYGYAWKKTKGMDAVDSFILHRHVDHGQEGGLNLGLWTRNKNAANPAEPAAKKKIYEVFRAAGTAEEERKFEFALPIIGIKDWSEIRVKE